MSADLIDDDCGLVFTGRQLVENHKIVAWAVQTYARLNGGAVLAIDWLPKLRTATANSERMSHVRHDPATFPLDASESSAANREGLTAREVASKIGVDPRTIYRWLERGDSTLALGITQRDPLRFEAELVEAYAKAHPRSSSAA